MNRIQRILLVACTLAVRSFAMTPQEMLVAYNNARSQHGLPPLCLNDALSNSAQNTAEMVQQQNRLDHSVGGSSPMDRAQQAGFNGNQVSENQAMGFTDAQAVVDAYMSEGPGGGHYENVLNTDATFLGVGIAGQTNVEQLGSAASGQTCSSGSTPQQQAQSPSPQMTMQQESSPPSVPQQQQEQQMSTKSIPIEQPQDTQYEALTEQEAPCPELVVKPIDDCVLVYQ